MAAYGLPVAFDDCCLSARLNGLLYARPSCWRFYLTPRESLSQKLNRDKEHLESLAGCSRPAQLERRKSENVFPPVLSVIPFAVPHRLSGKTLKMAISTRAAVKDCLIRLLAIGLLKWG